MAPNTCCDPVISSPSFLRLGRSCFAAGIIFFGLQHLFYGEFVTRLLPWPNTMPAREAIAWIVGALLMLAGAAIAAGLRRETVAFALGGVLFASALVFAIPAALRDASFGAAWTNAGKACTLAGGAWIVAASGDGRRTATLRFAAGLGRFALAWFLAQSGLQHFRWAEFVQYLVPAWVPGAMFWTYLTGVALVAAGVGLLIPRFVRITAAVTAGTIGAWVLLVHLPRALGEPGDRNEATALFEAIAITGVLLVIWAQGREQGSGKAGS